MNEIINMTDKVELLFSLLPVNFLPTLPPSGHRSQDDAFSGFSFHLPFTLGHVVMNNKNETQNNFTSV